MHRSTRLLSLTLPICLLVPLACGDDPGDGDVVDGGETGDGDGDSGDGDGDSGDGDGDSGDGDGDSGDGDGDSGDGDGDSGDGDGDSGDGDGDTPSGLSVELLLNSNVIRETNNGGFLTSDCVLFEDGLPAAEQPSFSYELLPEAGATDNGDNWTFDEFGIWTVSCATDLGGVELHDEREIAVLNDAIDGRLAEVGAALGTSRTALVSVLAADGGDDQLLIDAITQLATVEPALADAELDLAGLNDVLLPLPGGYPDPAALTSAGILANADDDQLAAVLAEVDAALDQLTATYAGFDPELAPTAEDLAALEAAGAVLDAALAEAMALEPSAHGILGNRQTFATSIRDHLGPALIAIDGYVIARAQAEADGLFGYVPPGPGLTPKFGLLGLTLGMFGQSNIRVKLINDWYGDYIAELDESLNNLILSATIDYWLPADPEGPVIELFSASASVGFAVPGYDTWAYGARFNSDPSFNLFLILGDQWQGAVDQILNSCGVSESNTIPENWEALTGCIEEIQQAIDSSINYPIEVLDPGTLGEQDVHLGPFPEACGGVLPVATLVIPINLAVGRGETWMTNCLP